MLQQRLSAGFLYHRLPAQGSRVLLTLGGGRSTRRTAAVHTAAKGADARPSRPIRSTVLSLLAVGGLGLSYLIYSDHLERTDDHPSLHNQAGIATQNVRFRRHIPHSPTSTVTNGSSKDPLSILDPAELASSTAHLIDLPLSQLMRAYIVFLASSSPFLVDIAPATIEKFEWLRENLPFGLGRPLWGLLVFVSYS